MWKAIKADLFTWQERAWSCLGFLAEGPTEPSNNRGVTDPRGCTSSFSFLMEVFDESVIPCGGPGQARGDPENM